MNRPVAIVTGAGSGIGRATCAALAQADFHLVLVGRDRSALEGTVASICEVACQDKLPSEENQMLIQVADISDWHQVECVVNHAVDIFKTIDLLVNNAAQVQRVAIAEWTPHHVEALFQTNLMGPLAFVKSAWPIFKAQRRGCVVNISSVTAHEPQEGFSAYAASKAALESTTRSMALEGRSCGIEAYGIALGAVETPLLRRFYSEQEFPPERALQPAEVAQLVLSCAQGQRRVNNGNIIRLDSR